MVTEKDKQRIQELCRGACVEDAPLKNYTSFKVGGPADMIICPEDRECLIAVNRYMHMKKIPALVIGEGTNLIVRDKGFRGVIVKLSKGFTAIAVEREEGDTVYVRAEAGGRWMRLVNFALSRSLSGLEFGSGIPGSVGGAVVMNAGAFGKEVRDVLDAVTIVTPEGFVEPIEQERLRFDYRTANLPSGTVVLDGLFVLTRRSKEAIEATMDRHLAERKQRQPLDLPSAGSVFRNPPGLYAARLIEETGLKGYQIGGAAVSRRHANVIVNRGGATAENIIALIDLIRDRVLQEKGVVLDSEVHIIGELS